jgi:hypothetical protein
MHLNGIWPCPLDRRLGRPQSRSEHGGENFSPYRDSNSSPSVVQSLASRYYNRYTGCANPVLGKNRAWPNQGSILAYPGETEGKQEQHKIRIGVSQPKFKLCTSRKQV